MQYILSLKNVTYKTSEKLILDNVNLNVTEKDFITITGPSGSGKTTALKLINNLLSSTDGTITYRNKNISEYNPMELRKSISLCFQMPHLFGETIFDNLSFPFKIRKVNPNVDKILFYLNKLNMGKEYLKEDIRNLSGGEKQRISIIRSLIFDPDILLLDEITSALDEENSILVEQLICELNTKGSTVLWITHNKSQNTRLGNRSVIIEHSKITEDFKNE
jgi:putative ABC transport system ATP-binding protein